VLSLAITPATDLLNLYDSEQFLTTATYSDGTTQTVTATWTLDRPGVSTITTGGQLNATGPGEVVLTASFGGSTATRSVRVVPKYGGVWDGGYRVVGCTETLDWRRVVCDNEDSETLWSLPIEFMQERTGVRGSVTPYVEIPVDVSGSIATDGQLSLEGAGQTTIDGEIFDVRIVDWTSRSANNVTMTGTFTVVGSMPAFKGEYRLTCELDFTSKVSAAPSLFSAARGGRGRAMSVRLPDAARR
jgi:hypothetical protein